MTWSGFRPSDDACEYGYLIPANMFAVVALRYISEIAEKVYKDEELKEKADSLREEIDNAIEKHGKVYEKNSEKFMHMKLMAWVTITSWMMLMYQAFYQYLI